jgi:hypothetical protein
MVTTPPLPFTATNSAPTRDRLASRGHAQTVPPLTGGCPRYRVSQPENWVLAAG